MKKVVEELKRHALTAISYMLPLVVASGLLIAIGNLMGGESVTELSKMTVPNALTSLGVLGMGLLQSDWTSQELRIHLRMELYFQHQA